MGRAALERAKSAWAAGYAGLSRDQQDERILGFSALVNGIARRGAVSPGEFAAELGIDVEQARQTFGALASLGVQVDEAGDVVGAALTARETTHHVRTADRELYAWCALDALFIPGLLGQAAEVSSRCPGSGATVRATVRPDGVGDFSPPETAVSVVLPGAGVSPGQTGPASPT